MITLHITCTELQVKISMSKKFCKINNVSVDTIHVLLNVHMEIICNEFLHVLLFLEYLLSIGNANPPDSVD